MKGWRRGRKERGRYASRRDVRGLMLRMFDARNTLNHFCHPTMQAAGLSLGLKLGPQKGVRIHFRALGFFAVGQFNVKIGRKKIEPNLT